MPAVTGPFDLAVIGRGLAAATLTTALPRALEASRSVVVQAPPGAGKTTLVPLVLADLLAGEGSQGRVLVTQPRRVAARAAARRLAQLTGTPLGGLVGYSVRGDRQVSAATRVEFVTDGLFVRRLIGDPDLAGVAAVVLDEIHERSLDGDLAFGMVREVAELREDLRLLVMSATLDADRWAGLLGTTGGDGPAPVVAVDAHPHSLRVTWAPPPPGVARVDARGVTPAFLDHVARVTAAEAASTAEGGVLVFLPGVREIDRVAGELRRLAPRTPDGQPLDVQPLHGRLPAPAQDTALAGGPRRRIVVATDVAESSLTVAGVRLVVDAGLSREPRLDVARGATRLVTVSASRASAQQRAGRAARLGPGRVVRLWPQAEWDRMRPERTAEIATADLTSAALLLACWGSPGGTGLALPQAPPKAALTAATSVLRELGAVGEDGGVTPTGRALAAVPADPREARALLAATGLLGAPAGRDDAPARRRAARRVAEAVAVLTSDERAPGADLTALARRLRTDRGPAGARWRQDADRFEQLARRRTPPDGGPRPLPVSGDDDLLGLVVALAHPGRIARRRGDSRDATGYLLAGGHGARLPAGSGLAGQEWLAVAELGGSGAGSSQVRSAAPITREIAERAGAALLTTRVDAQWNGRRVTGREVDLLGAIELGARPAAPGPQATRAVVATLLADAGLDLFPWPAGAVHLRRRLAVLHRAFGAPWPQVSTPALLAAAADWLGPELQRLGDGADPAAESMTAALKRLLPWPEASRLDVLAPERWEVPSGSKVRLDYPDPDDPDGRVVLAVKLQECFGLQQAPRIADGRVAVQVHLLSPAGRPLAVTEDLAFFWREAYPQVRAQMRGRYPKHPWPEDPLAAPPRRGTTRSGA